MPYLLMNFNAMHILSHACGLHQAHESHLKHSEECTLLQQAMNACNMHVVYQHLIIIAHAFF